MPSLSATLPPSTSSSLVDLVQRRDPVAWIRLTQLYGPCVYSWARRAGLQAADAADVVQLVFVAVADHIGGFENQPAGGGFRGWLWTIYRSKLMDFFRERRRLASPLGDQFWAQMQAAQESARSSTLQPPDDDRARLVQRAVEIIRGDFSERTWQAFWRTVVETEPTSQVAADLQLSPAAVCMSRARVLRRLRETLSGLGIIDGAS